MDAAWEMQECTKYKECKKGKKCKGHGQYRESAFLFGIDTSVKSRCTF